ncbi:GNAT family N-acetyltransferase [Microlunatus soli]|uniref:N-acetyltransferase domain-containing protein n=1 Tax=Microlunatus soli TaxID=630515 RepID=A0A1H1ZWG2_9ACTN|nr:GNAT family N-acetyltransferase [Microlunatus soli]SDT38054.1 hypothetical protein SAMN04489812_5504 [Microlunatus soli]
MNSISDTGPVHAGNDEPWTDDRILRALGEWGWAPEGTQTINTDDYRLLLRPAGFGNDAHVPRVDSGRPPEELVREINRTARERGYTEAVWSIYPTTRPHALADTLLRLGGRVLDEGALLSLAVPADGRFDVGPTPGVQVRRVRDAADLTDYRRIISTVYDQPLPSAEAIADEAAGIATDHAGCRFVAYIDGRPAGTGAIAVRADGSASLFGAATYLAYRRRGAYRAIMAERVRWAAEKRVPVLLVSGRLATSAPIMLRLGFTDRGRTRNIGLPTDPARTGAAD